MKWYVQGQRRLLDELTAKFNALTVETRIELLRLAPDLAIIVSRVVRYHESVRHLYENREDKHD